MNGKRDKKKMNWTGLIYVIHWELKALKHAYIGWIDDRSN